MTDERSPCLLRRSLLAGGAAALASAGLGLPSRAALAQSTIELPFANGAMGNAR